jgi:hypothetical protein
VNVKVRFSGLGVNRLLHVLEHVAQGWKRHLATGLQLDQSSALQLSTRRPVSTASGHSVFPIKPLNTQNAKPAQSQFGSPPRINGMIAPSAKQTNAAQMQNRAPVTSLASDRVSPIRRTASRRTSVDRSTRRARPTFHRV